jgi:PAS domain S-box-containing protein
VVVLFGLVLLCFIWGGLYFKVQSERQLELEHALSETRNYARTFEEHIVRTIKGMDQIALFLKYQAEKEGLAVDIPRLVKEGTFSGQPFVQLGIANENGDSVISSIVPFLRVSIRDLEHFYVHRDNKNEKLFVSKPIVGRTSGKWSIQLTRRINKVDGSFGGVVVVSIDPNYFAGFYKRIELGKDSSIALVGRDGIVRVLQTDRELSFGLDMRQSAMMGKLATVEKGSFIALSRVDGVRRIYSYRSLNDYPLVVAVGLSEAEFFQLMNQRIVGYHWFCGSMSGIIILFVLLLIKGITRRKQAEQALQAANESLEYKVEARTQEVTAANVELTAQNEEISAMNAEIFSLNQNLESNNASLEQRVEERTCELTSAHQELSAQFEELRMTGDHLHKLIQYASAPIIVWGPDFIITRFNNAFEQLSGYEAAEVIGEPVSILFAPEKMTETLELIERSRSGLFWQAEEITIRRKNGEWRVTLWNSTNIYAADGVSLAAVIAQGQDITERVRHEQAFRRDAQLATRVQNALLSVPAASDYLDIVTVYCPFGYVGGDLYFMDWRYDGSMLRGFLIDAAGHDMGTALHTASLHVLLREINERDLTLAEAMNWLNRRVGNYFDDASFAGAIGFEIDLATRQLRWVCAGIPQVWLATKTQQGSVECPGMCLGILPDESFDTHAIPIDVGDAIYFMTDGLSGPLKIQPEIPLERFTEMTGLLQRLSETAERRDDATAICICVRSLPRSLIRQGGWPRILRLSGYGDYQRYKGEVAAILAELTGLPHSLPEVAVNEALANAMECRDGVPRQHKARIRFNKIGNQLIIRVKTSRIGFAGNAVLRRLRSAPGDMFAFGENQAMGRGIPLMLSLSDKMTYNNDGTEVLLTWKLAKSETPICP